MPDDDPETGSPEASPTPPQASADASGSDAFATDAIGNPNPSAVESSELHSIGGVASETGISPDTLRMWERRYGRPVPVRLPSGHRRYTTAQVVWLRRVAEALALGARPRVAVQADASELEELLHRGLRATVESPRVAELLDRAVAFDATALRALLRRSFAEMQCDAFLTELVSPFLVALGRSWADGEIEVRHEHFASEVLSDELRFIRRGMAVPHGAPNLVLATLSGELHALGLQMVALIAQNAGYQPRLLGSDTPVDEIVATASELRSRAVAISVSLSSGGVDTDRDLQELRRQLPEECELLVGGRGARGVRRGPRGVVFLKGLRDLRSWLDKRSA
jgi:methanogenic corrinoid protein MtbC1